VLILAIVGLAAAFGFFATDPSLQVVRSIGLGRHDSERVVVVGIATVTVLATLATGG
jgi:hypothetical protein